MPHVDLNVAAVAIIFAGTYLVLALGQPPVFRIDRTGAALIGAILMVAVGRLSVYEAWRAIDYRTLILLFGMMVLVASLRLAMFFGVLARWIVGSIDRPLVLLVAVVFVTGGLSALFVNDTICLVFTPVLIEIEIYRQIDGGLLVLFMGLFVVIRGVEQAGLDRDIFALLRPIGVETVWGLSLVATILSNLTSNVPAVMLFSRLVPHLPDARQAWLALAMSSTLAGNLTILGSIANLIVVEGARRHGIQIRFLDYFRVAGSPSRC